MRILLVLFSVLPFLVGCADVILQQEPGGGCVPGRLGLRLMEAGPYVKSGTEVPDGVVEDVNVYIFGEDGEPVCSRFFMEGDIVLNDFPVSSGRSYSVYVLANWGEEYPVASRGQLDGLSYTAPDAADVEQGRGGSIMSGKVEGVVFPVAGDILEVGLRRLYCNVIVKFNFSYVNSTVNLKVDKVSIKNVPESVSLFSDNVAGEVSDGVVLEGDDLAQLESSGLQFSLFENMQGTVGDAYSNKSKAKLLSQEQRQVCSYIELECSYHSDVRTGTITYRFYLGTDHTNCNVPRNSTQTVTIRFRGKVSPDEYSVSVDNSSLLYRPTLIIVSPSAIQFNSTEQSSYQCSITVYPAEAYDKRVVWSTSNASIATVDQTGTITTQGKGSCTITVASVERPEVVAEVSVKVAKYTGGS